LAAQGSITAFIVLLGVLFGAALVFFSVGVALLDLLGVLK